MANSFDTTLNLCSTCHELFEDDDLSSCVFCDGRTCPQCVPSCCVYQVMETAEARLAEM